MGELMLSSVGGMSLCKANIAKTHPEYPHLSALCNSSPVQVRMCADSLCSPFLLLTNKAG